MFYAMLVLFVVLFADVSAMNNSDKQSGYKRSNTSPSQERNISPTKDKRKKAFSTSDPGTLAKPNNVYINTTSSSGSDKEKSPRSDKDKSPRGLLKISGKDLNKHLKPSDNYQELIGAEIFNAIKENNMLQLMDILYPNLNIVDKYGNTPLLCAVKKNNNNMVAELLEQKNIDVNRADAGGNTPLHIAFMLENGDIIKMLFDDYRVDSVIRNVDNFTASAYNGEWQYKVGIKLLIFIRGRLDHLVNQEVPILQMECAKETSQGIIQSIELIRGSIKKDYADQKDDRTLPDMKCPFKNKNFIKKMIIYRLKKAQEAQRLEKLQIKKSEDIQEASVSKSILNINNAYIT